MEVGFKLPVAERLQEGSRFAEELLGAGFTTLNYLTPARNAAMLLFNVGQF